MKVILLKDVPGVGRKYEVKEVSNGYGRNVLVSKKIAILATEKAEKHYTALRATISTEHTIDHELLRKNIETRAEKPITMMVEANDEGHLYAGIHQKEIALAIEKETRLIIPESAIVLDKPIKIIGEHSVTVEAGETKGEFVLNIISLSKTRNT